MYTYLESIRFIGMYNIFRNLNRNYKNPYRGRIKETVFENYDQKQHKKSFKN